MLFRSLNTSSTTVVQDCELHDSGSSVVKLSAGVPDVLFERVEVHHSGLRSAGNGFDVRYANRLVIRDSYIHDITCTAILLGGGSMDCLVERNVIVNVIDIGVLLGSYNTEAMYMNIGENPGQSASQATLPCMPLIYSV